MKLTPILNRVLRKGESPDRQVPGLGNMCQRGEVTSDGITVATYVTGAEDPEVTVVFVHGFTLAADAFFLQVRHIRDNFPQARCVLMDLRGHGNTGEVDPSMCTVDGAANDVFATIDKLAPKGPIVLVGHSLGGLVALSVIRRASDELRQRFAGLILVATAIESLSSQGLPQVLASPIADRAYEILESSPDTISRFRNDISDLLAPTLAATVFKRRSTPYDIVKFHADMIHKTPLSTFAGFFHDLQHHDEEAAAPYLAGLPGAVIVGKDDDVTPLSQSKQIVERWPGAELIKTKGVGHMLILEAPEILNEALSQCIAAATKRPVDRP